MRVLFDINHPAHAHFFKNPAKILKKRGHDIFFTSRKKECTVDLLNEIGYEHRILSSIGSGKLHSFMGELLKRNASLYRYVRKQKVDIMAAIGGTFVSHVGKMTRIPSLVFYDTENAIIQNIITYPLATKIFVPNCYEGWVPRNHVKYAGYHELSYLHPNYFKPDKIIAQQNGLVFGQDNFFIRIVSWKANHDLNEKGWPISLLRKLVAKLEMKGNIIISSESKLPNDLAVNSYKGNTAKIHHVMAFCRAYIGESATMASESAVLGVPTLYVARTGRGYTNEQEKKYAMVKNLIDIDYDKIEKELDALLSVPLKEIKRRHQKMIDSCIDVPLFVANAVEGFTKD